MWIKFNKMHGLGNDFMVVDLVTQHAYLTPMQIRHLADRNFGVGFDQLLLVEVPTKHDVDFKYRIFNADGTEVENCGNGARCFARFVYEQKLIGRRKIRVETASGNMALELTPENDVIVNMGPPILTPETVPFIPESIDKTEAVSYKIEVPGHGRVELGAVSMGNPHAVIVVDDIDTAPVATLGPMIEAHASFPKRVNAGFMQVINRNHIKLRVFERGAGETKACGTGACGAVVSGILRGLLDDTVQVDLPGGSLTIEWDGQGDVTMTGPTCNVFEGRVNI
ncbi:MAG: diaminopimelate epimerase [Oleispira sp.]|jgi:diaminopimelate epimerase